MQDVIPGYKAISFIDKKLTIQKSDIDIYKSKVLRLILLLSLFRLLLAFLLPLGNDESYYWLYSQDLKLNYFDHPPLVAFWIRIFTLNLLLQDVEVFIRLGSVVSCALATWFIYKTVTLIHSSRAGWFAAIFYNTSFYAGLTAGLYIMPDSPQMLFWTITMWAIAKIMVDELKWTNWLLLGITIGLCIMSKVHGAFLVVGIGGFILLYKRKWLSTPQPYVSVLIAALIASPIFIWNVKYDFVTYEFHTKRVSIEESSVNTFSFIRELFHQLFFNNPITTTLVVLGLINWHKLNMGKAKALVIYNLIGLPFAFSLLFISIFRDTTLPHWSGPAYVSLIPLAAISLAKQNIKAGMPIQARWAIGLFVFVLSAWTITTQFFPGTFGSKRLDSFGKYDISLDLYGWEEASKQFNALYTDDVNKGVMRRNSPLVCTYWWGAHVEYYFCRPYGLQMIGMGSIRDLREYWWMNDARLQNVDLENAYCIMPADENYAKPLGFYKSMELATKIQINRGGSPAHIFNVYRLKGWNGLAKTSQTLNKLK